MPFPGISSRSRNHSDRGSGPYWHPGRTLERHLSCYYSGVVVQRQRHRALGWLASYLLVGACDAGVPCAGVVAPAFETKTLELQAPDVSPNNLRTWVELLTSPELRGRHAGESGADVAAALVAAQMARIGLVPIAPRGLRSILSEGDYCRGFPFLGEKDYNVVGHLASMASTSGTSVPAAGERPVILLTAHYDGQGVHPAGQVYPGADDNASGVAGLLEVARLVALTPDPRTAWVFVAFGAEESGLQGARAFMSAPTIDLSRVELAINFDMIGRSAEHDDTIGYQLLGRSRPATLERLRAAATNTGIRVGPLQSHDEQMILTDAQVLAERLPAVLLSTGLHEDHHQLTDTPEKIDYAQIERAVHLVLALAETL